MRFYDPEINLPCKGAGLLHHLTCGHWVSTDKHIECGANCYDLQPTNSVPFNCPTCQPTVLNIIETQLSAKEKEKVMLHKNAQNELYLVGLLVEFVSKRTKTKANITKTIMDIVRRGNVGRDCRAADAPKNESSLCLER